MSRRSPPLQFLLVVIGGWIGFRIVALAPWWAEPPELPQVETPQPTADVVPAREAPVAVAEARVMPLRSVLAFPRAEMRQAWARTRIAAPIAGASPVASTESVTLTGGVRQPQFAAPLPSADRLAELPVLPPALAVPDAARPRRLGAYAWLFVRDEGGAPALAPGGMLGGSQAGLRLTYRLNGDSDRPLALSARTSLPLARQRGAEAAVGVDWRPVAGLPIHILAERREALGREGRSDFALTIYGGVERRVGPLRLEAYAQAGAVGHRDPDLFADGAARLTLPLGSVEVGGGVWGGAQPGVERLDVGPHVSTRLPVAGAGVRIAAEWRVRVAGDAAPGSGPALTLSTGF